MPTMPFMATTGGVDSWFKGSAPTHCAFGKSVHVSVEVCLSGFKVVNGRQNRWFRSGGCSPVETPGWAGGAERGDVRASAGVAETGPVKNDETSNKAEAEKQRQKQPRGKMSVEVTGGSRSDRFSQEMSLKDEGDVCSEKSGAKGGRREANRGCQSGVVESVSVCLCEWPQPQIHTRRVVVLVVVAVAIEVFLRLLSWPLKETRRTG